eukprot:TRINITY_DN43984_c0_g1_i1.p1 TRINITY_DN43984_c0_g1~~TRINITY_DN43984_c0_g1_i1.p1  ORF type:complete len:127 (+),score=28.36 TRINITY_DN43984_c0_g1_i1:204-584(+)
MLGLSGEDAVQRAVLLWESAQEHVKAFERKGGLQYPGGRTSFVLSAERLHLGLAQATGTSAIDTLVSNFRPNEHIHGVALIAMTDLIQCSQEGVPFVTPLNANAVGCRPDGRIWLRADMLSLLPEQ